MDLKPIFKAPFNSTKPYYEFVIDEDGPVVYSECCADRMTLDTAKAVHEALGRWIADQEGE